MNQINKNRLIGGSVIAFATLLFAPAILSPQEHDLSNPEISVSFDNGLTDRQVAISQQTAPNNPATTANIPIPPPPALKLESSADTAETSDKTAPKTQKEKTIPVSLDKKTVVAKQKDNKSITTKSSWLRVGSYASAKNADNQLKALNKSKYSVKVEQININGKTYHRVLVGPYNNEKTLHAAKKALMASGYEANIQR